MLFTSWYACEIPFTGMLVGEGRPASVTYRAGLESERTIAIRQRHHALPGWPSAGRFSGSAALAPSRNRTVFAINSVT